MLEVATNRVLAKNRTNSQEGEPPLMYKEVLELFKSVLAELAPGCPEHLLQTGDAYCGQKSTGHPFFSPSTSGVVKPNNNGGGKRPRIDKTPYDEAFYKRKRMEEEAERKSKENRAKFLEKLCENFQKNACSDATCAKIHKCARVVKKMFHGKQRDRVCMESHSSADHK